MAQNRPMGEERRPASTETSGAPGADRPAAAPRIALPTDLERSLQLLDDAQLHRLARAASAEVRRRGHDASDSPPTDQPLRPAKSAAVKPAGPKSDAPDSATVTPGQERLILAASEAGLRPAAIAREVRLSQTIVRQVIAAARRNRRKPQR